MTTNTSARHTSGALPQSYPGLWHTSGSRQGQDVGTELSSTSKSKECEAHTMNFRKLCYDERLARQTAGEGGGLERNCRAKSLPRQVMEGFLDGAI